MLPLLSRTLRGATHAVAANEARFAHGERAGAGTPSLDIWTEDSSRQVLGARI